MLTNKSALMGRSPRPLRDGVGLEPGPGNLFQHGKDAELIRERFDI